MNEYYFKHKMFAKSWSLIVQGIYKLIIDMLVCDDLVAEPTFQQFKKYITLAVSIKLVPFWPSNLEVWFAQVELQFTTEEISTQEMRYDHVVSSLIPEVAEVRELLLKPPDDTPYDQLKVQLIKCTAASEQRKLQHQLLVGPNSHSTPGD